MSNISREKAVAAARALLEPIVEAQQMELYDIELLTEYGRTVLRLYIEKEGGVTLDDCEQVNYAVEPALDADDPIPGAYVLEVSSPGIERKLVKDAHYHNNIGKLVEVKLHKPLSAEEKQKKFRGILLGLEEDAVVVSNEKNEERKLPRENLAVCRIVYEEEISKHG